MMLIKILKWLIEGPSNVELGLEFTIEIRLRQFKHEWQPGLTLVRALTHCVFLVNMTNARIKFIYIESTIQYK